MVIIMSELDTDSYLMDCDLKTACSLETQEAAIHEKKLSLGQMHRYHIKFAFYSILFTYILLIKLL